MTLAVRSLHRTFRGRRGGADVHALAGADLDARPGELLVVIGPSGSGKTTLLRAIAGLEPVDAGSISINGREVTPVPAGDRDVAMVFQDGALYPHLDVLGNVTFGLRARRVPRDEATAAAKGAAAILDIDHLLERRPSELSAGERQRVALARAIVRDPALFLLDEPLANLDAQLRDHARQEIRALQRRLARAMIVVTHDHVEAMALGDRIAVLQAGRVVQIDEPAAIYDRPATPFVARLLGQPPINLVAPEVLGLRREDGSANVVGIRPEHLRLVAVSASRAVGRVEMIENLGSYLVVHLRLSDGLLARTERERAPVVGEEIGIDFDAAAVCTFPAEPR